MWGDRVCWHPSIASWHRSDGLDKTLIHFMALGCRKVLWQNLLVLLVLLRKLILKCVLGSLSVLRVICVTGNYKSSLLLLMVRSCEYSVFESFICFFLFLFFLIVLSRECQKVIRYFYSLDTRLSIVLTSIPTRQVLGIRSACFVNNILRLQPNFNSDRKLK